MIVLFTLSALAATPTYQQPSEEVQAILDASSPPAVVVSPCSGSSVQPPTGRVLAGRGEGRRHQDQPRHQWTRREYAYRD